jgi:hypothetical protein
MSATVFLVMKIDSELTVAAIAHSAPVWLADTPQHAPMKESLKSISGVSQITWFPLRTAETLESAAVRITFSLDDHYNEQAQAEGYRFLAVIGANYSESMSQELRMLNFSTFEETCFGFVAGK